MSPETVCVAAVAVSPGTATFQNHEARCDVVWAIVLFSGAVNPVGVGIVADVPRAWTSLTMTSPVASPAGRAGVVVRLAAVAERVPAAT